jgi:hypothetical protein
VLRSMGEEVEAYAVETPITRPRGGPELGATRSMKERVAHAHRQWFRSGGWGRAKAMFRRWGVEESKKRKAEQVQSVSNFLLSGQCSGTAERTVTRRRGAPAVEVAEGAIRVEIEPQGRKVSGWKQWRSAEKMRRLRLG